MHKLIKEALLIAVILLLILSVGATINSNYSVNASDITSQEETNVNALEKAYLQRAVYYYLYKQTGNRSYLYTARDAYINYEKYQEKDSAYKRIDKINYLPNKLLIEIVRGRIESKVVG